MRRVTIEPTGEDFRRAARRLIEERVPPAEVEWAVSGEKSLFDSPVEAEPEGAPATPATELRVPRAFVALMEAVAPRPEPDRWRLLYAVLWRIAEGDHDVMLRRGDPDLLRLRAMAEAGPAGGAQEFAPRNGAQEFVPPNADLAELARAAASCKGCDLYRHATQTVFGRGPASARAVLVGEAPGDQEDLQGAPFVGPAGEVLDRALVQAGIAREQVYVTNAVKHFKFVRTPKRRIHQTPGSSEIEACRPWLAAELAILSPSVLVCLGATASKALLGASFRLMKARGRFLDSTLAPKVLATFHPSAVLRAEDEAGKSRVYDTLVADLTLAAGVLRELATR
ncbi:MAG TPA: UdgX family uracil-DNA binding protein [Vicinamibacteria bacterium]|nr:UdgX family uracil-DNA binding protein [Vicinamibacteria bacterium]